MKLYLANDELKTIQNALYTQLGRIEEQLRTSTLDAAKREIGEEAVAETRKLIAYLRELIDVNV